MENAKNYALMHAYRIPMLDASVIFRLNAAGGGLRLYARVKDTKGNETYNIKGFFLAEIVAMFASMIHAPLIFRLRKNEFFLCAQYRTNVLFCREGKTSFPGR